ncbi:wax ester/triacylglycerol synthase domain-containing protein [Amycolatopsis speibonae]|uniref:Wax ester/triacylglycerol synthase domain-containing protein n=1 Tax=Amycolatopsis speibonae TaxID=1450224 RepID=A0ABV7P9L4_9PSEU
MSGPRRPLDEVREMVESRVARLFPLTERLKADTPPEWTRVPEVDIRYHVREAPRQATVHTAHSLLGDWHDPSRPPWGVWLTEQGGDGTWNIHYVVHHARQDAGAALRTIVALLGDDEPPRWRSETGARSSSRGSKALLSLLPDLMKARLSAAKAPQAPQGRGRVLVCDEVQLDRLTAVARASGATVNQVHLAAFSEALDAWLPAQEEGSRRDVLVPVETSGTCLSDDFVNHLGLMRLELPVSGSKPDEHLRHIVRAAGRRRTATHRKAWGPLLHDASSRAVGWALRTTTDPTKVGMTASSVRAEFPLRLLGLPVLDVTAIPWLPPGHLCFALLVTYGDRARLSILAPEEAPDLAGLTRRWRESVEARAGAIDDFPAS